MTLEDWARSGWLDRHQSPDSELEKLHAIVERELLTCQREARVMIAGCLGQRLFEGGQFAGWLARGGRRVGCGRR